MKRRILWTLAISIVLMLALTLAINAEDTGIEDIFEFKGYSVSPFGTDACIGFDVNYQALTDYEERTGKTADIGIVFASYELLNGREPLDENANPIPLEQGKVITLSLNEFTYYSYDFKLYGITDEL